MNGSLNGSFWENVYCRNQDMNLLYHLSFGTFRAIYKCHQFIIPSYLSECPLMLVEVCEVFLHQRIVTTDDEQVLGILLLCRLREVEGSGDHRRSVDNHDLVMGKVLSVDTGVNPSAVHVVRFVFRLLRFLFP
jgi:hypothetical protein